jgi:hypothetical protein
MSHITYGEVFYMHDLTKTWTMTGNMITCPHAVLLLANAINMLPELQVSLEIREVFDALFRIASEFQNAERSQEDLPACLCVHMTTREIGFEILPTSIFCKT